MNKEIGPNTNIKTIDRETYFTQSEEELEVVNEYVMYLAEKKESDYDYLDW